MGCHHRTARRAECGSADCGSPIGRHESRCLRRSCSNARSIAVEVFAGNTADPKTVATQVDKLRQRFGLSDMVLIGDRGMITSARIREDLPASQGIHWIKGFFDQDHNNFAPRLGFAYDVKGNGRTVVRGGAGVYYAYNSAQTKLLTAEGVPWRPSASGGETRSLVDPWGTSRTTIYAKPPTPFTTDVSNFPYPPLLNNSMGFDRNYRTPYSFQWNLTVARQINQRRKNKSKNREKSKRRQENRSKSRKKDRDNRRKSRGS